MLYGENLGYFDSANAAAQLATAINLSDAAGAILVTPPLPYPVMPLYMQIRVVTELWYDTATAEAVLTLYKYPGGVAANKIALSPTMTLKNAWAAGMTYKVYISNVPTDEAPATVPKSDCNIGDQLAIWITTRGTGGSYLVGTYQPMVVYQHRAENDVNQTFVEDVTADQ